MSDADTTAPLPDEDDVSSRPPPKGRGGGGGGSSDAEQARRQLQTSEGKSAYEWLAALGGVKSFRIQLYRIQPKMFKNRKTDGHLRTLEGETISEDEIAQEFRGGKYMIKVQAPDSRGSWVFVGSKTIDIPGDPALSWSEDEGPTKVSVTPDEHPTVASRALDMAERMVQRSERASNEPRPTPTTDPALVEVVKQMGAMSATMLALLGQKEPPKPPENPVENKLLDKLVDGDNSRINALQMQWASERSMLLSQAAEDVKRAEARFDRTMEQLTRGHERETADLKQNHMFQIETIKLANATALEALKRENDHLARELTVVKTELAGLRSQKDEGPIDQLTKLAALKDAFEEISGGKEEASGWEKAAEIIAPIASSVGQGIGNVINRTQGAQPQGAPPPGFVPQGQGRRRGRTVVRGPAPGAPGQAQQGQPQPSSPPAPQGPQGPPTAAPMQPQGMPAAVSLDSQEVRLAISYIENALANGQKPEIFAESFRQLIPADIVNALRTFGVDAFLDAIQFEPGSRVDSVEGRAFVREVTKILTTGQG